MFTMVYVSEILRFALNDKEVLWMTNHFLLIRIFAKFSQYAEG